MVNPSTTKGGTINFGNSSAPDSTDPGNTYYAYMWNFTRLYVMPLMTYKSCPGQCGLQVVPDLATGPGVVSDNGLTWTYHIQPDVKFEDGTTVTSQDVKYAVERTFDRGLFPLGPAYFPGLLGGNAAKYPGPYKDKSKDKMGLTAVDTPDATTVVFHLAKPFADFNYVAAIPQTAPVPPNKDTGANYQLHPISTGPYMFQSYQLNKQLTLVPNPNWKASTDPNAKQLASKITMTMNMNANDIDNRLLAGDLQVDAAGTGVQAAARAKILSTPSLKATSDDPIAGFTWFAGINTTLPPLNNVHCRMAVEYAANKTNYQDAYGGPIGGADRQHGGDILPWSGTSPSICTGPPPIPAGMRPRPSRNCRPAGSRTASAPGSPTAATGPRRSPPRRRCRPRWARSGSRPHCTASRPATYDGNFAGVPKYAAQHGLGISFYGWAPDWPDGYGFFFYIADGKAISPAGNTNLSQLNDPVVNDLLDKMATTTDAATRNSYTSQIDQQIMKDAAILPGVYAKSLLFRPTSLTNVYVQSYYGMYNYAVLGVKS